MRIPNVATCIIVMWAIPLLLLHTPKQVAWLGIALVVGLAVLEEYVRWTHTPGIIMHPVLATAIFAILIPVPAGFLLYRLMRAQKTTDTHL